MNFIKGMDISMLEALEAAGAAYYLNGKREDIFSILKKCGADMIRLRLWEDPYDENGHPYGGGTNDLQTTIRIAQRASTYGLPFMLDFHYSDFWADPVKQIKPKAWKNLNGQDLKTAVYLHTKNVLKSFKNKGLDPSLVQIGNEITKGFLWPDGHVDHIEAMADLIKIGIQGVREEFPDTKIMLHLDFGTDNNLYRHWFDKILPFGLDFDIIGMSYYPHWNGSLASLLDNMNDISERYDKDIIIAETSIGYTTDALGCKGMIFSESEEAATGYPATKNGQEDYLRDLCKVIKSVKNHRGVGVFYWEPAWLPIPDCTWAEKTGCKYINDSGEIGNPMANQALFDGEGNANPALLNLKIM